MTERMTSPSAPTNPPVSSPSRSLVTLVVLLAITAALGALVVRPGRASVWPARTTEWLAGRHGTIALDVPPNR